MNRHRIKLFYDVPGWAYHHRCLALKKYAPADFDVSLARGNSGLFEDDGCDLYLQLCYSWAERLRKFHQRLGRRPVIVTGCNTGWAAEGPREGKHHFDAMHAASDWIVFNSRAAWGLAGRPERTSWISNGVDREVFYVRFPIRHRRPKVVWIGSTYHTDPRRDVKGLFLLEPLAERLGRRGIECELRQVDSCATVTADGRGHYQRGELCDWYNTATVYVCASQSEGTPNPALEAAACGCTVVSTVVGNMPELIEHGVNGLLVERNLDALESGVLTAVERYDQWAPAMQESIADWDWRIRAERYFELFRELLSKRDRGLGIGGTWEKTTKSLSH